MFPEESPWTWWGFSGGLLVVWFVVEAFLWQHRKRRALERENADLKAKLEEAEKRTVRPWSDPGEPPDDGRIRPRDTMRKEGVVTVGPTGYPERLTTWDRMGEGELSPPPGGLAPPEKPDE